MSFKVGDRVIWLEHENFGVGTITQIFRFTHDGDRVAVNFDYVPFELNNLICSESTLKLVRIQGHQCTCGASAVKSDHHSHYCDTNLERNINVDTKGPDNVSSNAGSNNSQYKGKVGGGHWFLPGVPGQSGSGSPRSQAPGTSGASHAGSPPDEKGPSDTMDSPDDAEHYFYLLTKGIF